MGSYIAFLRAVNVGGTGRLPMADLRALCEQLGFAEVRTYIASGNVVFASKDTKQGVRTALESALAGYANKPVGVVVRTAAELRAVLDGNPFAAHEPSKTMAILLNSRPPADTQASAVGQADEEIAIGRQEIYVHYPGGMGSSKLRIPAAKDGTARNMNTLAKMLELASKKDKHG